MATSGYAQVLNRDVRNPADLTVITLTAPGGWQFVFCVHLNDTVQNTHYKPMIREHMKRKSWRTCVATFTDWRWVRVQHPDGSTMNPRQLRPARPPMNVNA